MKITLPRRGNATPDFAAADFHSENLAVWGQVDRLHSVKGTRWLPEFAEIERHLEETSTTDIPDSLKDLEGQFVAVWRRNERLRIFCDRFALKQVYYRVTADSIELFDRIMGNVTSPAIDRDSAMAFLLFRFVPGRRTLFRSITRLMPGDCLILDTRNGEITIKNATVYPRLSQTGFDPEANRDGLHSLFREAMEARLRRYSPDERLLIPTSGGMDSRYILGTALELTSADRLVCMTYGMPGSFDFEIGKAVAKAAGVRHVACPLSPDDYGEESLAASCRDADGQISVTTEPPLHVYSRLAEHGRIVLSGYVGDSVTGRKKRSEGGLPRRPLALKDAICSPGDAVTGVLTDELVEESFFYEAGGLTVLGPEELWFFTNHFTKYSTYCIFKLKEHFTFLTPFVDHAFLDGLLQVPDRRVHRKLYVSTLVGRFPKLAAIPCKSFNGAAPAAGEFRKRLAFQWQRFAIHALGDRRSLNTIDFRKHERRVLGTELQALAKKLLPPDTAVRICEEKSLFLVRYNLKCLELLATHFDVRMD